MRLMVRPQAQDDLLATRAWYERRAPDLGLESARSIDAAIARTPLAYPRPEAEFRRAIARKFPYSVIYHPTKSELVVAAFFHHRRRPGEWLERAGNPT